MLWITPLCTMNTINKTTVTYRIEIILGMSRDLMSLLPSAQCGRHIFGHPKAIRHYLLTGNAIDEKHSDALITDDQFAREFTRTEMALAAKTATISSEKYHKEALDILADYHRKIAQGFTTLSIIDKIRHIQGHDSPIQDI